MAATWHHTASSRQLTSGQLSRPSWAEQAAPVQLASRHSCACDLKQLRDHGHVVHSALGLTCRNGLLNMSGTMGRRHSSRAISRTGLWGGGISDTKPLQPQQCRHVAVTASSESRGRDRDRESDRMRNREAIIDVKAEEVYEAGGETRNERDGQEGESKQQPVEQMLLARGLPPPGVGSICHISEEHSSDVWMDAMATAVEDMEHEHQHGLEREGGGRRSKEQEHISMEDDEGSEEFVSETLPKLRKYVERKIRRQQKKEEREGCFPQDEQEYVASSATGNSPHRRVQSVVRGDLRFLSRAASRLRNAANAPPQSAERMSFSGPLDFASHEERPKPAADGPSFEMDFMPAPNSDSNKTPWTEAVGQWLDAIWQLTVFEEPGLNRLPKVPPLPPSRHRWIEEAPAARLSHVIQQDIAFLKAHAARAQWFLDTWRLPLQEKYSPSQVDAYFFRRFHLVVFRLLQVSSSLLLTWLSMANDTSRLRQLEAEGLLSDEASISCLRQESAQKLKNNLVWLGPTFIKVAQSLSARPDIVGPDTAKVLSELQDRLPPFSNEAALQIIQDEFGRPAPALFPDLSGQPVAAASFGQVYEGRTSNGQKVAIKVQRPNVLFLVARDIFILRLLLQFVRRVARINSDLSLLADEFGRGLFGELDYRHEAANAMEFAAAHKHLSSVVVPSVRLDLTSRRVLTMEWVEGERATDLLQAAAATPAAARGAKDEAGGQVTSPQQQLAARQKLLSMVGIGIESSLEQLFVSGLLHADPHPGNLIFTPDGKLAYLDFGLLCRMDSSHQSAMLAAIANLVNQEWEYLADDLKKMDVLKPSTDRRALVMALEEAFGSSEMDTMDGEDSTLRFGQVTSKLWALALRFRFRLPPYYTLVLRSLASLEGIGLAVDPQFRVFAAAYPYVVKTLLTDASPSSQAVLRQLIVTRAGELRWQRLLAFVRSSLKATRDEAIAQGSPTVASFENQKLEMVPSTLQPSLTSSPPPQTSSRRAAADVLHLLLSRDASSSRRIILESDMTSLAEAFTSPNSAPARRMVANILCDAFWAQQELPSLEIDSRDSSSFNSSYSGWGKETSRREQPVEVHLGLVNSVSMDDSNSPSFEGSTLSEVEMRRLWLLFKSALFRVGNKPFLRLNIVTTMLGVVFLAFVLYFKRLILYVWTLFWRIMRVFRSLEQGSKYS